MLDVTTRDFKLRHFRMGDADAIVKHANNLKIYRATIAMPYPYRRGEAVEWIEQNHAEEARKHPGMISLAIVVDGEAVGCIGLSDIEGHKAAVGYWLAEEYWGRGIMTGALKLTTRYALGDMGLRRLYATVFLFNKASMRVLEKCGYRREGILRKETEKDGRLYDMALYAKVR